MFSQNFSWSQRPKGERQKVQENAWNVHQDKVPDQPKGSQEEVWNEEEYVSYNAENLWEEIEERKEVPDELHFWAILKHY